MSVDEIATEALEIDSPERREAFLADACGDDHELRDQVDALLKALQMTEQSGFLNSNFFGKSETVTGQENAPAPGAGFAGDDRFELRSRHAIGGLGEVWIAWDKQLRREVALKQIRPQWGDNLEAAARFRREAEITGYLEHPGVVPIYALGEQPDGRPFYAMQFIRGTTLEDVATKTLSSSADSDMRAQWYDADSLRKLLNQFVSVCQTIDYAHSKNVIHRDLKPANIMLGAYGETLVVDWGLAKVLGEDSESESETVRVEPRVESADKKDSSIGSLAMTHLDSNNPSDDATRQGSAIGTPRYMSPEQARGDLDNIGPATDIYCLGATLYFLLTGQPPHVGEDDLESTFRRISEGRFAHPAAVQSRIPKPLEAIVLKAMATDPSERYESAGTLADDLGKYLGDQPVSVFRDPMLERVLRWIRRNRAAAAAIAVTLLLSLVGVIIGEEVRRELDRRSLIQKQEQLEAGRKIAEERETRRTEALSTAEAAQQRAESAIEDSRFAEAARLIDVAIKRLNELPSLKRQAFELEAKRDRLARLGRFTSLSEVGHDLDFLSRDTEAAILLQQALSELGVWDSDTWWDHLPDADLNAIQRDHLRWEVYRSLIALSAIHLTNMVAEMGGNNREGVPNTFRMLRSFLAGTAGIREAKATIELTKRVDTFRPSQYSRWLRSIAEFRLREGPRIEVRDLGPPENAIDGHSLATCSLIASQDARYRVWFNGYGDTFLGENDLDEETRCMQAALETLRRVSDDADDYYNVRLKLSQTYYLYAQAAQKADDYQQAIDHFELARSEAGRCIAIRPDNPFGYADRSTIALRQSLLIRNTPTASEWDKQHAEELLRTSMKDARQAQRLSPESYWVYWHLGATAAVAGQTAVAKQAFFDAVDLGFDLQNTTDSPLITLDDLRGRDLAFDWLSDANARESGLTEIDRLNLLAALEYSRRDYVTSRQHAEAVLAIDEKNARANQIAGWCAVEQKRIGDAESHFSRAVWENPSDAISMIGHANLINHRQQSDTSETDSALVESLYRSAIETARSDRHRAAAWLGLSELQLKQGDYPASLASIHSARQLDPACELTRPSKLIREEAVRWLKQSKASNDPAESQLAMDRVLSLRDFLNEVSSLPIASVKQIIDATTDRPPSSLPLLNGDFELPIDSYWNDVAFVQSTADAAVKRPNINRDSEHASKGQSCLRIEIPGSNAPYLGGIRQRLPATPGFRYEISVDARSQGTLRAVTSIHVRHKEQTFGKIDLVDLDETWTRYAGSFAIPMDRKTQGNGTPIELEVTIQLEAAPVPSSAAAILLDDLRITCEREPSTGESG